MERLGHHQMRWWWWPMLTTCFSEIIISGGDSNQSTLVMPLVVVHSLISRLDQRPDQTRQTCINSIDSGWRALNDGARYLTCYYLISGVERTCFESCLSANDWHSTWDTGTGQEVELRNSKCPIDIFREWPSHISCCVDMRQRLNRCYDDILWMRHDGYGWMHFLATRQCNTFSTQHFFFKCNYVIVNNK